jgi:hypothetical protein
MYLWYQRAVARRLEDVPSVIMTIRFLVGLIFSGTPFLGAEVQAAAKDTRAAARMNLNDFIL